MSTTVLFPSSTRRPQPPAARPASSDVFLNAHFPPTDHPYIKWLFGRLALTTPSRRDLISRAVDSSWDDSRNPRLKDATRESANRTWQILFYAPKDDAQAFAASMMMVRKGAAR